jgi:iron complex outermembrane recepter protein
MPPASPPAASAPLSNRRSVSISTIRRWKATYQLDDVKQIEVLRGPQGTLYGAGALGGALRIIPNAPVLNEFSGTIEASGGRVDHSSSTAYTARALVNVPIGDTLAIRVPVKYDYQPGFVDTYGLFKRSNNGLSGIPLLADPAAPLTSPAIYQDQPNWNYQRTITMRPSILWQPVDAFSAELAVLHSYADGDGGPQVNRDFPGGVSPIDPATTLPAGGYFREFSQIDQPWSRHTNVASLDLSYDAGFATLSSTSSYHNTSGSTLQDNTYSLAGLADGGYVPYYAGVPTNPRFVYDQLFADTEHTFAQEIRLVSKTRLFDNLFDYVVGAYYENQTRTGSWTIAIPGTPEYQAAQGCTAADCGGGFFIATAPGDVTFPAGRHPEVHRQVRVRRADLACRAESPDHLRRAAFRQQFTDSQSYDDYPFPTHLPATPHESPASKTVGKVNPSYEYATDQFVYALWSQGFRRGGANSVPLAGPFRESPLLSTYQPDTTNNYEAGFKGRLSNAFSYTVAVFDIKWDHPQISSSLPSGNLAVYNAKTAESKGVEFESSGPLFLPRLAYSIGFAYADAHLTSNFSLPANNGAQTGTIVPGLITWHLRRADARQPEDQHERGADLRSKPVAGL